MSAFLKLLSVPGCLAVILGLAEIGQAPSITQQIFGILTLGFGFLIILLALGLGTAVAHLHDIREETILYHNELRAAAKTRA